MDAIARTPRRLVVIFAMTMALSSLVPCGAAAAGLEGTEPGTKVDSTMDRIAERFVKLALAVGEHDPVYVDAYFGPAEWREEAKAARLPLAEIRAAAAPLIAELERMDASVMDEAFRLRRDFLAKQLESLVGRVIVLEGTNLSFDEESMALFDIVAPPADERRFKEALARIDALLPPGEGTLIERLERFKKDLVIPKDRLDAVFAAAIAEARRRTKEHIPLPDDESFTVEYVKGASWGAYNWYQGGNRSVIQINTDFPTSIDAPLGLACHEGYPGHHVQNVLFEQGLVKDRGWIEFTVSPLFSPVSPINEGAANFGIEVAFPGDSRRVFEREVLYPLAGIDTAKADAYFEVRKLMRELGSAENEAARRYLGGTITADEAAAYLSAYSLRSPERSRRLVTFFDQYRSYVITYNVGYDLVKSYIIKRGGTADRPKERWEEFRTLISLPRVPSQLR